MVAVLRMSRDANCGNTSARIGDPAGEQGLDLGQGQGRPDLEPLLTDVERAQLGQPVHRDDVRRPLTAEVGLDAPVGAARDDGGVGTSLDQGQRLGEVCGSGEPVDPRRHHVGSRRGDPFGQMVAGRRRWECPGRVADRPVAGAAAQVAAHRVQVEAVRAVLGVLVAGCPVRPVELRSHAADEPRRAVAALRPAPLGHLPLDGVQVIGSAEPFGGDDLLAVEGQRRHQAGVDRGPLRGCRRPPDGPPSPSTRRTHPRRSPPWPR